MGQQAMRRLFHLSGLVLIAGVLGLSPANASQVFVCDDGRAITVAPAELEAAKRTEPCVAKHFGIALRAEPVPLPIRHPERSVARAAAASAPGPSVPATASAAPASSERHADAQQGAPQLRGAQSEERSAMQDRLSALEAGDFRRVRVINGSGAAAWYNHAR